RPIKRTTHCFLPDGIVADERGYIDGDVGRLDFAEQFCDIECRTAAIADDNGRDTHANKVFGKRLFADFISVCVNIDEAWGDDETLRIDFGFGVAANAPDFSDAAVFNGDIGEEGRISRAVHDSAMADDDVESFGMQTRGCEES